MKKIIAFALLLCVTLTFAACANKESSTPEITVQSLYDATNVPSLLEKYNSVHVQKSENGKAYEEEYFSKEYHYIDSHNDENSYAIFSTDHSHYMYYDNMYVQTIVLTSDGIADMKSALADDLDINIYSSTLLNDTIASVTEKDGQIIVKTVLDQEELDAYKAEGWTIGEDEHVLDAKTLKLIYEKASYSKTETGENYEGAMHITYDGEIPENMKKFMEYDQQTENLRTVTIVSNPGASNEETETVKSPKGLQVVFTGFADDEKTYTLYADAACTQVFEADSDFNSDLTVYVKWDK